MLHSAGLDVYDAGSGEHVLWAFALPTSALPAVQPFICRYHSHLLNATHSAYLAAAALTGQHFHVVMVPEPAFDRNVTSTQSPQLAGCSPQLVMTTLNSSTRHEGICHIICVHDWCHWVTSMSAEAKNVLHREYIYFFCMSSVLCQHVTAQTLGSGPCCLISILC